MSLLSRSLPKYRKHLSSGQAIVELNGHRVYLGPHGTKASRIEYDRQIAEWLQNGRQLRPQAAAITVVELIVRYLTYARGYYRKNGKPTNEVRDITLSLRPLRALYAKQLCAEFGLTALKASPPTDDRPWPRPQGGQSPRRPD